MRTCTACGSTKPLTEFYLRRDKRDGRAYYMAECKPCMLERCRRWRNTRPEEGRAYDRRVYRERNGVARSRAKHERYREQEKARKRAYYAENAARLALESRHRRRGVDEDAAAYALLLRGDPCVYCGAPFQHVDHIDALANGGAATWDNLTAACRPCNQSKGRKVMVLWLTER